MRTSVDLIVSEAAEVVTVAGGEPGPLLRGAMDQLEVVPDGAVALAEGRIVAVGPAKEVEARYDAPERLSAQGGTVLPGLVDPHTHPVFAATREGEFDMRSRGASYQEITTAGGGIFSSVRALREASREQLADRLKQHLDRFLACGTTTIEAKSGYGLTLETELLALELLAEPHPVDVEATCLAAHQVPPEFREDRAGYLAVITDEILPAVAERGLARSADVFCDEGAYTVDEARVVLQAAERLGLERRVHADELAPVGAAELAAACGARTADHLVCISDAGIEAMASAGTTAVLLPGTCFSLRLPQVAPARRLIEAGVPVALATDFNPGTCHIPSMLQIISLGCSLLGLTVAEAIVAATRNAAATLDLPGPRGVLQPGAVGDLIVLDVPNHLFLGYQSGWNPVREVVKQGRHVVSREASAPSLL